MALSEIAQTSQGPMVGDYISTSFSSDGRATTVFPVGHEPASSPFDEAMYSPGQLAVATTLQATHASSSQGVAGPITGVGTGETHQALKSN